MKCSSLEGRGKRNIYNIDLHRFLNIVVQIINISKENIENESGKQIYYCQKKIKNL